MGHCNDEWYEGVVSVARKTPLMSSMGADTHLQHDLQYNSALKQAGTSTTQPSNKQVPVQLSPQTSRYLEDFSGVRASQLKIFPGLEL